MKGWGVEGATESGGARVSSPFGGSRSPTLPLKGTKPNSIVFKQIHDLCKENVPAVLSPNRWIQVSVTMDVLLHCGEK